MPAVGLVPDDQVLELRERCLTGRQQLANVRVRISRIDLDGAGSPHALVTRILELVPDLSVPVPVEQLCQQLDITKIEDLDTDGFEAALLTNDLKAEGAILVARDRPRQRRRFSIAHELGHFLIPAHLPPAGQLSLCSAEHLRAADRRDEDRRRRMEAEANRFAALLLMPPPMLRAELQSIRRPDVADLVRLAKLFDVSKDALARACTEYTREAVAKSSSATAVWPVPIATKRTSHG